MSAMWARIRSSTWEAVGEVAIAVVVTAAGWGVSGTPPPPHTHLTHYAPQTLPQWRRDPLDAVARVTEQHLAVVSTQKLVPRRSHKSLPNPAPVIRPNRDILQVGRNTAEPAYDKVALLAVG
jgi:hypothetical protein